MDGTKTLGLTLTAALAVETVGALDPYGPTPVYLPPPSRYLATYVVWFILGLASQVGPKAAKLAGAFSYLTVLSMMVLGPFGGKFVAFLNTVANVFPAATPEVSTS